MLSRERTETSTSGSPSPWVGAGPPLFAQSCAWAVLAFCMGQVAPLLDLKAFRSGRLPTWVDVLDARGNVVGMATAYYDNYHVVIDDDNGFENVQKTESRTTASTQTRRSRKGQNSRGAPKL
jgi:hypothetical protein